MTHSFPESLSTMLRVALFFLWVGLEKKSSPALTSDNLIIQRFVSRINRPLSGGPSPFRGSSDLFEDSKCLLMSVVTALLVYFKASRSKCNQLFFKCYVYLRKFSAMYIPEIQRNVYLIIFCFHK